MAKRLELHKLTLRNFKGARNFVLDLRGRNAKIFGDNETGKTTTFDGFVWLLFDKDSKNKKEFGIKTLENGEVIHNLDHEVEGVFLLDGKQLTLRKVYAEKWTQQRGSATSEFTGHTTKYFIDGVPAKKHEYEDKVNSIVQEDVFKLLTSPSYFNERLLWNERRKILLEICGDVNDLEVISSDKKLAKLPNILGDKTIEDHRKIIATRRSDINKELEKIPVRIDEITRSKPDTNGLNKEVLKAEVSTLNTKIDDKMTQINSIKNGKSISDKQKVIQEIEIQLLEIRRDHDSDSKEKIHQLKARIQEEKSNKSILESKLENLKTQKRYNDENIKDIETNLVQLRQAWNEINDHQFTHTDACECPACGQALPEEQVEAAKEKALSQFNLQKAQKLEDINSKGKKGKERKEGILQENEKLAKEYEKLNGQIAEKRFCLKSLEENFNSKKAS
ncbi:AAA family ATPase [Robertmurraya massiliosenegalensis]|uniref:AAA family ATPase n=1 Tax=Robertmurraya TaxID=2837507 RepID=UPI0039A6C455